MGRKYIPAVLFWKQNRKTGWQDQLHVNKADKLFLSFFFSAGENASHARNGMISASRNFIEIVAAWHRVFSFCSVRWFYQDDEWHDNLPRDRGQHCDEIMSLLTVTRFETVAAAAVALLTAEHSQSCRFVWGKERKMARANLKHNTAKNQSWFTHCWWWLRRKGAVHEADMRVTLYKICNDEQQIYKVHQTAPRANSRIALPLKTLVVEVLHSGSNDLTKQV